MPSFRLRTLAVVTAAGLIGFANTAGAQDSNYWTLQYGTRGELLGGVVVGSAVDLSATYYNPGSLSLVEDPSVILTATVIGVQTIRLRGEDSGQDVVSSQTIGPQPSMLAGLLPMEWFGGRVAYSFLTRQKLDFRLQEREGAIIGYDVPGDTLSLGGEIYLDQDVSEQWGGLTWSKRAGERLGVGATLYGVYRSQTTSIRQTVDAIGGAGFGASLRDWYDINYYSADLLVKIGVEAELAGGSWGLSITTPNLNVFGSGDILINRTVIGDPNFDGTDDSASDVSYGKDVDVEYRSPFSIAIGGSYDWETTTMHATAEFFTSVDEYTVMEAAPPPGGPGVTAYPSEVNHALNDVLNFGVGIERRFSEDTTAYVSFITDRSAFRVTENRNISVSTWDIYHLNGGVVFAIGGTDLTVGGGYAWGSNPIRVTPDSEGQLPPTIVPTEVTYSRLKFILGFAL